jgi:hypothetical protein
LGDGAARLRGPRLCRIPRASFESRRRFLTSDQANWRAAPNGRLLRHAGGLAAAITDFPCGMVTGWNLIRRGQKRLASVRALRCDAVPDLRSPAVPLQAQRHAIAASGGLLVFRCRRCQIRQGRSASWSSPPVGVKVCRRPDCKRSPGGKSEKKASQK